MTNNQATMTVQEAMEALGVSDKTIRRLLKRGDLEQHGTIHGRILITAASVEQVRSHVGRPQEEPEAPAAQQAGTNYAMVPVSHYEALQATTQTLAETVRDQAAYIRQLQEELTAAREQRGLTEEERARLVAEIRAELQAATSQPGQESPSTSLRTSTIEKGSVMQHLRKWLGL